MTPLTEAPAVDLTSIASEIASHLNAIEALIPGFAPPDPARRKHVSANARFANDSIAPSITAVQNYPPLQQTNIFDVEAGRYALALRDAVRPQLVRMQAIVDGGNFTIDDHMAESGVQVLQMYNWSQRHLRLSGSDGLRPYADEIGRTIQKAINHRRTRTTSTPTGPQAPQSFMAARPIPIPDDVDEIAKLIAEAGEEE